MYYLLIINSPLGYSSFKNNEFCFCDLSCSHRIFSVIFSTDF